MYSAWKKDPSQVHLSWQIYFKNLSNNENFVVPNPPTITSSSSQLLHSIGGDLMTYETTSSLPENANQAQIKDHMKVQLMVRAYQVRGHELADIDPLGIHRPNPAPELDYKHYGFTEADLDRSFQIGAGILPRFKKATENKTMTLREIIQALQNTYSKHIGVEYGHISDRAMCDWIRERIEVPTQFNYSKEKKLVILDRLIWSDSFERFVAQKYPSEKRFGLEGCESLIPGMKAMIDRSVELGIASINIGMPHRGRLNVLSNVVRKPNESIFSEFTGSLDNHVEGSGDVKYHLGMNYFRPTPSGKMVHLSLAANPSHLEAVDPVVMGKVRGLQFYQNDADTHNKAMGVLLHGDAAFSGQGVVYETLGMSDLPSYTTGGCIHIIANNQVGFTTDPRFSRSTPYCSDVAKTVNAPILHVNGDDVEAVVFALEFASEWRAKFKKDVVVDLVCYRKYGHNETDQPGFTQPLMYQKIKGMKPVANKYVEQLLSEGEVTLEEIEALKARIWDILEKNYEASKTYKANSAEWVSSTWPGFKSPAELAAVTVTTKPTGVSKELLKHIGRQTGVYPAEEFKVHSNLQKILKQRQESVLNEHGIDYATAEALAFGSLLTEGTHVRLSGQDVERGTFSHRHSVLHDQNSDALLVPLNNLVVPDLVPSQAHFSVSNSSLSEYGILGFELGYSFVSPNQLVMWEAQFGDFANTAQCIIDQFISCGEQKWLQRTGLTLLLPHGYDGQGPEHSSARIERFLQMCDEDPYLMPDPVGTEKKSYSRQHQDINMAIVYPSTPSNYFHVLRRQIHRDFRKPLIVFNSKALLRHPLAKSNLAEMEEGTRFQRLIPEVLHPNPLSTTSLSDEASELVGGSHWQRNNVETRIPYGLVKDPNYPLEASLPSIESSSSGSMDSGDFKLLPPNEIKTVIFCTGQVYYLLHRARTLNQLNHIAIVRIEQLCPFPFWEVQRVVDFYGNNLEEIVWCQEESFNAGAWQHVEPRFETSIRQTTWYNSQGAEKWRETLDNNRYAGGLENIRQANKLPKSVRGGRYIRYAGRDQSAAPATGIKKQHKFEEVTLVSEAFFNGDLKKPLDMGKMYSEEIQDLELVGEEEENVSSFFLEEPDEIQDINWSQQQVSRTFFRRNRILTYRTYKNLANLNNTGNSFNYETFCITKPVKNLYTYFSIKKTENKYSNHFQLRNLLWATSKNDVFIGVKYGIDHYCPKTGRIKNILDLQKEKLHQFKISSICAKSNILSCGGFYGEFAFKLLNSTENKLHSYNITKNVEGITNHIDIIQQLNQAVISSNDQKIRFFDFSSEKVCNSFSFDFPINCTGTSSDLKTICMVGDSVNSMLIDQTSGKIIHSLTGHTDYSFSCAFSPDNKYVTTGSQDLSTRIYDRRNLSAPLTVIRARIGAVRSLRFTEDSQFLAIAEPADFVHILDLNTWEKNSNLESKLSFFDDPINSMNSSSYGGGIWCCEGSKFIDNYEFLISDKATFCCQTIDFFGEIGGISFSDYHGDSLFIGNIDELYGGLIEFERNKTGKNLLNELYL
ncbi:2-oxoglutarate dehydrogenase E1 component [Lobulomyces angularis]|nr:2-oxoglutarate dehydrogenase E1 component [Lobulomyces angularis]